MRSGSPRLEAISLANRGTDDMAEKSRARFSQLGEERSSALVLGARYANSYRLAIDPDNKTRNGVELQRREVRRFLRLVSRARYSWLEKWDGNNWL
jgi:hypothetical protein